MARNKLETVSSGNVLTRSLVDSYRQAIIKEIVPRGTATGAPSPGESLGTPVLRWGEIHCDQMLIAGNLIDENLFLQTSNTVVSGRVRSGSTQGAYIVPAGSGNGAFFSIQGASTNLLYRVGTELITLSFDLTEGSLTTAPVSQNTATIDEATMQNESSDSRVLGERGIGFPFITVTGMGTEMLSRVGKIAAFRVINSTTVETEYFIGFIESATKISNCRRGFFYGSNDAPIPRIALRNGLTISLMSFGYVFLEKDANGIFVSYTQPQFGSVEPATAASGDYFYDTSAETWKRYNGSSFVAVDRILIGYVVVDAADCVGARCLQFFDNDSKFQTVGLEYVSSTSLRILKPFSGLSVGSNDFNFHLSMPTISSSDIAASPDSYDSALSGESWWWYAYITGSGEILLSNMEPYFNGASKKYFHPFQKWGCVGRVLSNGTNFSQYVESFSANRFNPGPFAIGHYNTTDNITPISTYVALTFDDGYSFADAGFDLKDFVEPLSSTTFRFLKAGIHEIFLDVLFQGLITGGAQDQHTHRVRLYDVTASAELFGLGEYQLMKAQAPDTADIGMKSFHRYFKIKDCSHVYRFESAVIAGTSGTAGSSATTKLVSIYFIGKR